VRCGRQGKEGGCDARLWRQRKGGEGVAGRPPCFLTPPLPLPCLFNRCIAGDRPAAAAAFAAAEAKTAGAGQKLDARLALARLDMARGDWRAVQRELGAAAAIAAKGGDWERRNRLKVYAALAQLATRDLAGAAAALVEAVPTFTATELCPYATLVLYAAATGAAALPRPALKTSVIDSPEVRAVAAADPVLASFLDDLHACKYAPFMAALASMADRVGADRLLAPHARHWARAVRGVAYSQFLEPYRAVTLDAMAASFGVSPAFIDAELADLIASGRVPARIDRVAGTVLTRRPDARAARLAAALKAGDALLNRLQRLSKLADHEG
jgi:26S proteasome regulatory subunit N7